MSDLVTVAVVVSAAPTLVGILNFVTMLISRGALVDLKHEVNHRLDQALKAEYARGRADVIAESKQLG